MSLDPFLCQLRLASIFGGVLFLMLSGLAAADAGKTPGSDGARIEEAAQRLRLSEDQKLPFRQTMLAFRSSVLETLDKHGVDPESEQRPSFAVMYRLRSDMKRNQAQLENQLATFLTPRQMQEFGRIQKERRRAGFPGRNQ